MKFKVLLAPMLVVAMLLSCNDAKNTVASEDQNSKVASTDFDYNVEQFADIKILRYQIPGWENLSLNEQKLVYYLTQNL